MLKTEWQLRMHKKKYTLNLGMCNSDHLKEESTKRYGLDCIDSIRKQRLLFGRDSAVAVFDLPHNRKRVIMKMYTQNIENTLTTSKHLFK